MAITLGVGPVSAKDTNTGTATVSVVLSGTTIGRQIIAGLRWYGTSSSTTISSITCTGESNLTIHGSPLREGGTEETMQFASLANNTTGGDKTLTLTLSGTGNHKGIFALEVAGGDTTSFFNAEQGTTGSSTNPTGSVTTTANNCAVVAMLGGYGAESAGAGFTGYAFDQFNSGDMAEYDLDVGTAGVISVPFVNPFNNVWIVKAAAFNVAAAPPVSITPGVGSLGFTGHAPIASIAYLNIIPNAASLVVTGIVPVVVNSQKFPGAASLSLTGYAPLAEDSSSFITTDVGALALSGKTPGRVAATLRTPSDGSITVTGKTAVVVSKTYRTPGVGALVFTGIAVPATAHGAPSLEEITSTGLSFPSTAGVGSSELKVLTGTGEGTYHNAAVGAATLEYITCLGGGPNNGAASLKQITAAGLSSQPNPAWGGGTLKRITAIGYGPIWGSSNLEVLTGLGYAYEAAYPQLESITGTGEAGYSPIGAASLEQITATGLSSQPNPAWGNGTLKKLTAVGYYQIWGSTELERLAAEGLGFEEARPELEAITGTGEAGYPAIGAATLQRITVYGASGYASLERIQ